MSSFLRRLFTRSAKRKNFRFLIVDRKEEAGEDQWYRLRHWESPNFLKIESRWSKDWRTYSDEEPVVGVTKEDRHKDFLILGDQPGFRVFLEREPSNPHDQNAVKVMGSATVDGIRTVKQLGYLSRETAEALKNEDRIDARPYSVYLPYADRRFGIRIRVLVRSQAYLKRTGKAVPRKAKGKKAATYNRDIRKEVFEDFYDYFDDAREDYDCKKVSKTLFRTVFDVFFDKALKNRNLSEDELNETDTDLDVDLSGDLVDAIDDVIEKLFEMKPELEKQ